MDELTAFLGYLWVGCDARVRRNVPQVSRVTCVAPIAGTWQSVAPSLSLASRWDSATCNDSDDDILRAKSLSPVGPCGAAYGIVSLEHQEVQGSDKSEDR